MASLWGWGNKPVSTQMKDILFLVCREGRVWTHSKVILWDRGVMICVQKSICESSHTASHPTGENEHDSVSLKDIGQVESWGATIVSHVFFQLSQCAMCLHASHVGSIPFQSSLLIWVMVAPAFEGHCECCTVIQWYPVAEFLIMVGIQNRLMVLLFNRLILIELIDPVGFNSFGWNRIAIQKILADPFSFSKLPCYLGMSSSVLVAMEDDNCINISVYSQEW